MSLEVQKEPVLNMVGKKPPWLVIVFVWVVFAITGYSSSYPRVEGGHPVIHDHTVIEVGGLKRQVVFSALGLFGVVSLLSRPGNRMRIQGSLGWLILLFAMWSSISLLWTSDFSLTFRRLVLFWMLCFAALAVAKRFSFRDVALLVLFYATLTLVIGVFVELRLHSLQPFVGGYRFAGRLHPNAQGLSCGLMVLSGLAAYRLGRQNKYRFLILSCVGFAFLILTKSRTSFFATIVSIAMFLFITSERSRKGVVAFWVVLAICLIFLFGNVMLPAILQGILLGRTDESILTLVGRIPLWWECLGYCWDRPLLGYGHQSFWTTERVWDISDSQGWNITTSHSMYLDLFLSLGVIGLFVFVSTLGVAIRRAVANFRISRNPGYAYIFAIVVFFVARGFLESGIMEADFPLFLFMVSLVILGFQELRVHGERDEE